MSTSELDLLRALAPLTRRQLRAWVRSGWIKPTTDDGAVVFAEIDVARARLLTHLRYEVGLSNDAIAMVLSLTDQVYGLRRELRRLARAVEQEPSEVRLRITPCTVSGVRSWCASVPMPRLMPSRV